MKQPLVEGVDFYWEGDKFVLSEVYHRKRGYCCNSKCRHCPYKADTDQNAPGDEQPPIVISVPVIKSG